MLPVQNLSLVLGSASPRRQELLHNAGFSFRVIKYTGDENFDASLPPDSISKFLAAKKSASLRMEILDHEILITADTIVSIDDLVLNKPKDKNDAMKMLQLLSGRKHTVFTGVCISNQSEEIIFCDATDVHFRKLTKDEIEFYINHYQPFDKAGSYGAQDWIGLTAIEQIQGSYFNVMGLPVHLVYEHLQKFVAHK